MPEKTKSSWSFILKRECSILAQFPPCPHRPSALRKVHPGRSIWPGVRHFMGQINAWCGIVLALIFYLFHGDAKKLLSSWKVDAQCLSSFTKSGKSRLWCIRRVPAEQKENKTHLKEESMKNTVFHFKSQNFCLHCCGTYSNLHRQTQKNATTLCRDYIFARGRGTRGISSSNCRANPKIAQHHSWCSFYSAHSGNQRQLKQLGFLFAGREWRKTICQCPSIIMFPMVPNTFMSRGQVCSHHQSAVTKTQIHHFLPEACKLR